LKAGLAHVRLQLHALDYNFANFVRTLTLPPEIAQWSMSTLRNRLVKIGAKIVRHACSLIFQMSEVGCIARSVPGNSEGDHGAPPAAAGPMLRITVSDSRRVYGREARAQTRWLWIGRPVNCALAALQRRSRPAMINDICVKKLERDYGQLRRAEIDGSLGESGLRG
jgi:hypothetical protein